MAAHHSFLLEGTSRNFFQAVGVFSALEVKDATDQMTAGVLAQNEIDATRNIVFQEPVQTDAGLCAGAFIPHKVMADFVRANGGQYPMLGDTIEAGVMVNQRHGNMVVSMRPTIGGTQSAAA